MKMQDCNCSMPSMMMMYFHFGYHNVTVLFEGWDVNSVGAMVGSFIAIFVMAMLYEGLKVFREVLQQKRPNICAMRRRSMIRAEKVTSHSDLTKPTKYGAIHDQKTQLPVPATLGLHVIQTLLHMLQVTVSYFLMLIVMTYNVWLFISVILGAGTGYFLFARFRGPGNRSLQDENEHCH